MRRLILMISLLVAGAGTLLAGALPASAVTTTTTATSLASSANPSVVGDQVTFTATVTANGGITTPTGQVVFSATGGMTTTAVTLTASGGSTVTSVASTMVTFTLPGSYTVTAMYNPDGPAMEAGIMGSSGSLIQVVKTAVAPTTPAPTMTTTTPAAGMTTTPAPGVTVTTPAPGVTVTTTAPGAVVPVGAVGTGGGGSLGGGVNAALVTAGSLTVLAGAGLGGLAWRRRRHSS